MPKTAVVFVPDSLEQADKWVARIGEITRQIGSERASFENAATILRQEMAEAVEPLQAELSERLEGLAYWAEVNRQKLTNSGQTKTVKLPSGELRWRKTPPKVNLRSVAKILVELKKRGLHRFIRTKEEINKEAMLAELAVAEAVPGVTISSIEEFIIKPLDLGDIVAVKRKA